MLLTTPTTPYGFGKMGLMVSYLSFLNLMPRVVISPYPLKHGKQEVN